MDLVCDVDVASRHWQVIIQKTLSLRRRDLLAVVERNAPSRADAQAASEPSEQRLDFFNILSQMMRAGSEPVLA